MNKKAFEIQAGSTVLVEYGIPDGRISGQETGGQDNREKYHW